MARQARKKDDFGVFHIIQQGGENRKLFESDDDRIHFLRILSKAHAKFQFKLYAYCLIDSNAYHLILDVNGGDLSKVMKSINISYAMYVKSQEKLFRDRYKSILLDSENAVDEIMARLRANGQKHLNWNSFCFSQEGAPLIIDSIPEYSDCKDCIRSIPEALHTLSVLASAEGKTTEQVLQDKNLRNELIRSYRSRSTLSLKELGSVFGGLSESSISKILNP